MGLRILLDRDEGIQALYCSTKMRAFGPLFDIDEDVDDFLDWFERDIWCPKDPRSWIDQYRKLESAVSEWRSHCKLEKAIEYADSLEDQLREKGL